MKGVGPLAANHHVGTWRPYLDAEKGPRQFGSRIIESCCSTHHGTELSLGGPTPGGLNLVPVVLKALKWKTGL